MDTVTASWLPDVHYLFGDKFADYGFDDTRYITHDLRLMLTLNTVHPQCWRVTKVNELQPKGILKLVVKEDEYDEKKDNLELMVCNYYDEDGDVITDPITPTTPDPEKTSVIYWGKLNDNNELIKDETPDLSLKIGTMSYFISEFSDNKVSSVEWRVSYINVTPEDENLPDKRKDYYCGLLKVADFGESHTDEIAVSSISIRPNKNKGLIGKKFLLSVQNHEGEYFSSIELEVQ